MHADELGDTFTDDMVERIEERLGHPERCPHGWPVDPAFEQARERRARAARRPRSPASEAEIVRLAEHDGELLHWFYDEGFVPGARVVIREAQPAAGQFKVDLGGSERAIGEKAAAGLYVRPGLGSLSANRDAFIWATASIVTIGLTPEAVGKAEPSATTRLRTSHVSPAGGLAAERCGELPIRAEPMMWNE